MKPLVGVFIARDSSEYERYRKGSPGGRDGLLSVSVEYNSKCAKGFVDVKEESARLSAVIDGSVRSYLVSTEDSDLHILILDAGKEKETVVEKIDELVKEATKLEDFDPVVFVHWGNLSNPADKDNRKKRRYSISSLRENLFKVSGAVIHVPRSRAEFNALEEKFGFANESDELLRVACLGGDIGEAMKAADKLRKGVC